MCGKADYIKVAQCTSCAEAETTTQPRAKQQTLHHSPINIMNTAKQYTPGEHAFLVPPTLLSIDEVIA